MFWQLFCLVVQNFDKNRQKTKNKTEQTTGMWTKLICNFLREEKNPESAKKVKDLIKMSDVDFNIFYMNYL